MHSIVLVKDRQINSHEHVNIYFLEADKCSLSGAALDWAPLLRLLWQVLSVARQCPKHPTDLDNGVVTRRTWLGKSACMILSNANPSGRINVWDSVSASNNPLAALIVSKPKFIAAILFGLFSLTFRGFIPTAELKWHKSNTKSQ